MEGRSILTVYRNGTSDELGLLEGPPKNSETRKIRVGIRCRRRIKCETARHVKNLVLGALIYSWVERVAEPTNHKDFGKIVPPYMAVKTFIEGQRACDDVDIEHRQRRRSIFSDPS